MIIPYQYNKMAAGGITEDQETHARTGVRGVFTFLANGRCNQSAMTMYRRFLDYRNVSRMEVSSGGLALNTTLGYYGTALIRSGGTMSGITVNSNASLHVSSGGTALDADVNEGASAYISQGGSAIGGNVNMSGKLYVSGDTVLDGFHIVSGGHISGMGSGAIFRNIVISSGAVFSPGQYAGVSVSYITVTQNASFQCGSMVTVSHASCRTSWANNSQDVASTKC